MRARSRVPARTIARSATSCERRVREAGDRRQRAEPPLLGGGPRLAPKESVWSQYGEESGYADEDAHAKAEFVGNAASASRYGSPGTSGRTRARSPRSWRSTPTTWSRWTPIISRSIGSIARPSATVSPTVASGGRSHRPVPEPRLARSRAEVAARARPARTVLCLALLHHLVIGGNIPLPDLVAWLAGLGGDLVVEFVTREDARVEQLLRNRVDQYFDYDLELFERCLAEHCTVLRRQKLASGTRILYHARPRAR